MQFKDFDKTIAKQTGLKKYQVRNVLKLAEQELYNTIIKGITVKIPKIVHFKTKLKKPLIYYNPGTRSTAKTGKRFILKAQIQQKIKSEFRKKKVY